MAMAVITEVVCANLLEAGGDINRLLVEIMRGRLDAVKHLLERVEVFEGLGYQLVRLAVMYNHVEVVGELLKAGCKAENSDLGRHNNAIFFAVARNNVDILERLSDQGADLSAGTTREGFELWKKFADYIKEYENVQE